VLGHIRIRSIASVGPHWCNGQRSSLNWRRSFCPRNSDRRNKTIARARNSFDETRIISVVIEGSAKFLQNHIEAAIEIHEGAVRPEIISQKFTGNNLARMLQKQQQNAKRLVLYLYAHTITEERFVGDVGLEQTESKAARGGS
jgi:hypothetical protein